jgi:hypothetical protein
MRCKLPVVLFLIAGCSAARGPGKVGKEASAPPPTPTAPGAPTPSGYLPAVAPAGPPKAASALVIPGTATTSDSGVVPATLSFASTGPVLPLPPPPATPPPPPPVLPTLPPLKALDSPETALPSSKSPLRDIYEKAARRYQTMDTYIMRLRRREVVAGSARPEEIMLCKVRKEPFSVYFKWLGTEGKGREVTYSKGKHGDLIHSLTATGDVLFLPGGKRFRVAPDSILVKSKTRYPITEAGFGPLIERFGRLVGALEKGDPSEGSATLLGELKRPELENKVIGVEQRIPPKSDPNLPRGGVRHWFFDPANGLPVLVITHDEADREVEFYCHDRFLIPANLTDDDFNPDLLWNVPG